MSVYWKNQSLLPDFIYEVQLGKAFCCWGALLYAVNLGLVVQACQGQVCVAAPGWGSCVFLSAQIAGSSTLTTV